MCLRNPSAAPGLAARLLVRTLPVFTRSIKPHERAQAVESEGNSRRDSRRKLCATTSFIAAISFSLAFFSGNGDAVCQDGNFLTAFFNKVCLYLFARKFLRALVVVMTVVKMWKNDNQRTGCANESRSVHAANGENSGKVRPFWGGKVTRQKSSQSFNTKSA